jgi:hypothetical protein
VSSVAIVANVAGVSGAGAFSHFSARAGYIGYIGYIGYKPAEAGRCGSADRLDRRRRDARQGLPVRARQPVAGQPAGPLPSGVGAAASSRSIENRTPALADAERIWALLQEGLLDCLSSTSPSTLVNVSEAMGSRHVADGVQVAAS